MTHVNNAVVKILSTCESINFMNPFSSLVRNPLNGHIPRVRLYFFPIPNRCMHVAKNRAKVRECMLKITWDLKAKNESYTELKM